MSLRAGKLLSFCSAASTRSWLEWGSCLILNRSHTPSSSCLQMLIPPAVVSRFTLYIKRSIWSLINICSRICRSKKICDEIALLRPWTATKWLQSNNWSLHYLIYVPRGIKIQSLESQFRHTPVSKAGRYYKHFQCKESLIVPLQVELVSNL
jgi:hypothetical protein